MAVAQCPSVQSCRFRKKTAREKTWKSLAHNSCSIFRKITDTFYFFFSFFTTRALTGRSSFYTITKRSIQPYVYPSDRDVYRKKIYLYFYGECCRYTVKDCSYGKQQHRTPYIDTVEPASFPYSGKLRRNPRNK